MLDDRLFVVREAVYRAAAAFVRRFLSETMVQVVLGVCGIWCLLTPLLLWVAWTREMFLTLLAASFVSCVIFCLVAIGAQDPPKRRKKRGSLSLDRRSDRTLPGKSESKGWRGHI